MHCPVSIRRSRSCPGSVLSSREYRHRSWLSCRSSITLRLAVDGYLRGTWTKASTLQGMLGVYLYSIRLHKIIPTSAMIVVSHRPPFVPAMLVSMDAFPLPVICRFPTPPLRLPPTISPYRPSIPDLHPSHHRMSKNSSTRTSKDREWALVGKQFSQDVMYDTETDANAKSPNHLMWCVV